MGKTCKGEAKAAAKAAAAKRKIARKCKGRACGALACALGASALLTLAGCATSESAQPAKSQTQNNEFNDCIVVVAASAVVSNRTVTAAGGETPTLELFTQTQALETGAGATETLSPYAAQTPTTDVKPDLDVRYNDALAGATSASKGVLETLLSASADKVLALMSSRGTGKVSVTRKDGTPATVECADGQCTYCEDGACSPPKAE